MAVTVRQFKISSGVCSRFKPHMLPLLRFWKMDPSLPGVDADCGGDSSAVRDQLKGVQQIQATNGLCCHSGRWIRRHLGSCRWWVRQFKISSGVCSRFKPHMLPLLRFWQMDPSWPGVDAVGGDSSAVRDQLKGVQQIQGGSGLCCDSGRWICGDLGLCKRWRWQFGSSRSAQGCAADSSHWLCLCCDSGRWIRGYLGSWRLWRWQLGSSRSAEFCLVQLCFPKWQSLRSYSYRNRRCWSFCSAVTPSGPGCWKRWGSYKRSQQKCCFFVFFVEDIPAVDLASQCFFRFNTDTLLPLLSKNESNLVRHQTTSFNWMDVWWFPSTFYFKDLVHHPTQTTIEQRMFRVPGAGGGRAPFYEGSHRNVQKKNYYTL